MTDEDRIPPARLVPRDGNEQLVVIAAEARVQARRVGRTAWAITRALALVGACLLGLFAVGYASRRSHHQPEIRPSIDFEKLQRATQKIQLQTEQIRPLIDVERLERATRELERLQHLRRPALDPHAAEAEGSGSPAHGDRRPSGARP